MLAAHIICASATHNVWAGSTHNVCVGNSQYVYWQCISCVLNNCVGSTHIMLWGDTMICILTAHTMCCQHISYVLTTRTKHAVNILRVLATHVILWQYNVYNMYVGNKCWQQTECLLAAHIICMLAVRIICGLATHIIWVFTRL